MVYSEVNEENGVGEFIPVKCQTMADGNFLTGMVHISSVILVGNIPRYESKCFQSRASILSKVILVSFYDN